MMKNTYIQLFSLALFVLFLGFASNTQAQGNQIRASQKASITQNIGADTEIIINYSRPGVKGRKVYGGIVPYGLEPGNQYSNNKPFPWRAGANENTTIEINQDVMIEGKTLPAGKYSIHMIPSENDWVVIFNKNSELWGSYQYNEAEDALRVTVTPKEAHHEEWLSFEFFDITDNSVVAALHWEKLMVPFNIKIAGS